MTEKALATASSARGTVANGKREGYGSAHLLLLRLLLAVDWPSRLRRRILVLHLLDGNVCLRAVLDGIR